MVVDGHSPSGGVDIVSVGSAQHGPGEEGDCFVVRISDREMTVAHRFANQWGICWKKTLPARKP